MNNPKTPFERFEQLAKTVVRVPKKEVVKPHAQIAELERDNANQAKLLEVLRETIAELERERDAANKRAKEYVDVFKRVNAAKRVWRKRAEQAEAKLVEAQSRLIAGAVYEKLDSVKYWKARAEQAEAELGAAINQRNIARNIWRRKMSNEISMDEARALWYQSQTPKIPETQGNVSATDKNQQDLFDAVTWLADDASTSDKKRVRLLELAAKVLGIK